MPASVSYRLFKVKATLCWRYGTPDVFSISPKGSCQMTQECEYNFLRAGKGLSLDYHPGDTHPPCCRNTTTTRRVARQLIEDGFMVDYAPDTSRGDFFRAVVNSQTTRRTVERLVEAIERHGMHGWCPDWVSSFLCSCLILDKKTAWIFGYEWRNNAWTVLWGSLSHTSYA